MAYKEMVLEDLRRKAGNYWMLGLDPDMLRTEIVFCRKLGAITGGEENELLKLLGP